MALINGNEYDHIDFTKNGVTTRHPFKDTLSRQMSSDLVKVQDEEPTSEGTKIWIKPSGDSEVQVPTYEEFEELSDKIDDADATIESLAVGAQPTVSVTDVDGHKRFSFGIPASNGVASITKTATDGVIDTYTIAMTDGTSTSFSVNNSDITPESMAEAISTALQDYARIDGYYPDLTAGNADQLNSTKFVENKEPYLYRPSGGTSDIGNRKYLDAIVGVSLPWNQMVRDEASENQTDFADILTVTDAVEDSAALKVKIEPQQDLHGYDHPWPAGGGKNKFTCYNLSYTSAGVTVELLGHSIRLQGTATQNFNINTNFGQTSLAGEKLIPGTAYTWSVKAEGTYGTVSFYGGYTGTATRQTGNFEVGGSQSITVPSEDGNYYDRFWIGVKSGKTYNCVFYPQLEEGATKTEWTPYSNICPITGWTGAKVSRTGKNLLKTSGLSYVPPSSTVFGVNTKRTFVENSYCNGITYNNACQVGRATDIAVSENSIQFTTDARAYGVNIPVIGLKAGRAYTVSAIITNGIIGVGFYEQDGTYISGTPNANSFTVPDRTYYVLLAFQAATENEQSVFTEIQLELGSTATAYEPYSGNTYDITLPSEAGTVYGGDLTVNADGSGSLVVDRYEHTFDGTETSLALDSSPNVVRFTGVRAIGNFISLARYYYSHGVGDGSSTTVMQDNSFGARATGYCYLRNSACTTLQDFKDWFAAQYAAGTPVQISYIIAEPITYTLTASEVTTLLGQNNIWADTGDVALTYTGTNEHLTLESGKKYLARINGTDSMLLGSAQEITAAKGTDNVFDLTKMFGTSVADYVYNQGAGYFRKWFGKTWYPYNTGELKHVEGLQSHDLVGFNLFDPSDIRTGGAYNPAIGVTVSFGASGASYSGTNPIVIDVTTGWRGCAIISRPLVYGQVYRMTLTTSCPSTGDKRVSQYLIDENNMVVTNPYNYVGNASDSIIRGISVPRGGLRCVVVVLSTSAQKVEVRDACIYLTHNGSRNGEYEPYEKHSHPLDNTVILRGVPKVDSNGVYWDGDRYLPDGTVERRYGVVDLGTLLWNRASTPGDGRFFARLIDSIQFSPSADVIPNIVCCMYKAISSREWYTKAQTGISHSSSGYSSAYNIIVYDSAYTSELDFKVAMSGVYLVYELAEPTTEQALPYRNFQLVDDWGTEKFVTTGMIPVGHESRYPANLRDKLQHLPDAANSNGSYLITQTDGQMILTPFPAPPTTAGKYALRATVTNGVATFTWEATT